MRGRPSRLIATALQTPQAGPFDLSLAPGECAAITGPSGSGKTLLLRMLADLDDHRGEAWLDGVPRSSMPAADWRRRVRYAAAEPGWWHDTVGEHFRLPPGDLFDRLNLPTDILTRAVALCSTGERQRLALARALLDSPPVLLLDEPTAALDEAGVAAVEHLLRDAMSGGTALILVTHNLRQAEALGTQHLHVAAGRFM